MATAALTPLEQYLRSDFEPDAEFVDGEVEHRASGEYDHSTWQQAVQQWFVQHAKVWNLRVRCELRVQVSPTRFRIPDVVVFDRSRPIEQILAHLPIAVFEILSPEDTISRLLVKLDDYEHMGILATFVVDPSNGRAYRYAAGELRLSQGRFSLEDSPVIMDWSEIAGLRD